MVNHVQAEHISLSSIESSRMSAFLVHLASTVSFLDRPMQLVLVVPDSCAEAELKPLNQMMQIMVLAHLAFTAKKEQQMAQSVRKEHLDHTLVPKLAMTVCHALEGSTAMSLDCWLQLLTVAQVTTAQQKKTFVIQIQVTSSVQLAIFVQMVLPIHSVVDQGRIKVVSSKCLVMFALKVTTVWLTPLIH